VYDGSWGFNGLLCAMCLGGLFFVVNWHATVAAVLCSVLSTVIMNVLISPFAQVGFLEILQFMSVTALCDTYVNIHFKKHNKFLGNVDSYIDFMTLYLNRR
jgi:urea transporter